MTNANLTYAAQEIFIETPLMVLSGGTSGVSKAVRAFNTGRALWGGAHGAANIAFSISEGELPDASDLAALMFAVLEAKGLNPYTPTNMRGRVDAMRRRVAARNPPPSTGPKPAPKPNPAPLQESLGAGAGVPEIVARARKPKALTTSIRASIGESEAYKESLRRGEIGLQRPGRVTGRSSAFSPNPARRRIWVRRWNLR